MTTFITQKERYFFCHLPFGTACASVIFQREMTRILQGVDGVYAYQDDIIVVGSALEQHGKRLENSLRKLSSSGLKLNQSQCDINKPEVKYFLVT